MILITGATGLVGAHLILHLLQENEQIIKAIYRDQKTIKKTKSLFELYKKPQLFFKIEWVKADVLDIPSLEIAFQNVDFVYHCAAFISFNPNDEAKLRKINIEGTANIVNFCIAKKITKLCHISSIAALGDLSPNQTIIDEQTDWNPEVMHSDYAISKYGAEIEVWRAQQEGVQVVIVNPGIIIGPYPSNWNKKLGSGALFTSIKNNLPFYTSGTSAYVAVVDVVKILHLLMNSPISGERFTLIAENKTYKDIIYTIANKMNAKKPRLEAKPWMLAIAWRIDWFFATFFKTKRMLSKNSAKSLTTVEEISNQKIKKTLHYNFIKIDDYLDKVVPFFI